MAKDAKGHGSDGRGGGPASYQNVSTKPLLTNAARDRLAGMGSADAAGIAAAHGIPSAHLSGAPTVVKDDSVPGTTHKLVGSDGSVIGRLYKSGSPAWR